MDRTGRLVRGARRRFTLSLIVDGVGRALVWGAVGACVVVVVGKVVGWSDRWWWAGAGVFGFAFVLGIIQGVLRRPSMLGAAGRIDERLRLKDRLSNGVFLFSASAPAGSVDPFVAIAKKDADAAAGGIRLAAAAPIVFGREWAWWPVVIVIAGAIGVWMPSWNILDGQNPALVTRREAERARLSQELAKASKEIRQATLDPAPNPVAERQLAELDSLRQELESGKRDPAAAANRAAEAFNTIAERSEQRALAKTEREQAVRDALIQAGRSEPDRGAETKGDSELARALRDGDFAKAAEAARKLLKTEEKSSDVERQDAAESLDRLARDLDEMERRGGEQDAGTTPKGSTLENSGKQPRNGLKEPSQSRGDAKPDAAESQQGVPSPSDRAKESEPRPQSSASDSQTPTSDEKQRAEKSQSKPGENPVQSLRDSVRRAAEELRKPSKAEQKPGQNSEGKPEDSPEGVKREAPKDSEKPSERQRSSGQQEQPSSLREKSEPQPGQGERQQAKEAKESKSSGESGSQKDQERSEKSQQSAEKSGGPRPSASGDQKQPSGQSRREGASRQSPTAEAKRSPDQQGETGSELKPDATGNRSPEGKGQPQPEQSATKSERSARPSDQPGTEKQADRDSGKALQDLERQLESLAKSAPQAAQDRKQAEELRRQAQEMLEKASPDQREQMRKWAEQAARRGGMQEKQDERRAEGESPREGDGAKPTGGGGADESRKADAHGAGSKAGQQPGAGDRVPREARVGERTELVDARQPARPDASHENEQVAAQWLGPGDRGAAPSAELSQRIEQAARSADRAIEDHSVPARFDRLLERYFRRLPEQVRRAPAAGPAAETPLQPAKDAQ